MICENGTAKGFGLWEFRTGCVVRITTWNMNYTNAANADFITRTKKPPKNVMTGAGKTKVVTWKSHGSLKSENGQNDINEMRKHDE